MPWLSWMVTVGLVGWLACTQAAPAHAQAPPKQPSVEQVEQLLAAYQRELDESAATYAAELLIPAQSAARRARSALQYKRLSEAAQAVREARWLLPITPPDLPAHVKRVIGNTRLRHANAVTGVAYNPVNAQLASCSRDGTIRFWDLANGRQTRSIYVGQAVRTLAWSPDGTRLAAAVGKEVYVYDPATGKEQFCLRGHSDFISCLAFQPDGQALASGSDDRSVRVWDWQGNARLIQPEPGQPQQAIVALTYSRDGQYLLQLDQTGALTVLAPQEQKQPQLVRLNLVKEKAQGSALALAANGRLLAASLVPGKVHLFELTIDRLQASVSVSLQRVYDTPGMGTVTALGFDKTGQRLVTSSNDANSSGTDGVVGNVRIWDTLTGKLVQTYRGHTAKVDALAIAPDGSQIASGGQDQNVKLWSLGLTDPHRLLATHRGEIWSLAVSPDGKLVAAAGSDGLVRVYDYADGTERYALPGHRGVVNALAFAAQGDTLVSGGADKLVKVWDIKTGKLLRELPTEQSQVMALAVSLDGKQLAAGGSDRSVYLWTLATGKLERRLQGVPAAVTALVYCPPAGRFLAVGDAAGGVKFYDCEQGNALPNLDLKAHVVGVSGLCFNAAGTLLATCGGESRIRLYSVQAGPPNAGPSVLVPLTTFDGHTTPVSSVAFSPDGSLLASCAGDQTVKIWSIEEKTELRTLRGHTDWVSGVVFAPDGRSVITVGVDRSVRVWDTRTSESPTPPGHWRAINALSVTADSQLLVTASDDRSVRVWNLSNGAELAGGLFQHTSAVNAVSVSPDGKLIVSASRTSANTATDEIKVWDRLMGQLRRIDQTPNQILLLQFTPDSERVCAWQLLRSAKESNSLLTMHRLDPWQKLVEFGEQNRRHTCVGLSADGIHAAFGGPDGSVRVWDIVKRQQLGKDIAAHRRAVTDVGLSSDNHLLFTATSDAEVKIWDLEKAELLHSVQTHDSTLAGLIVSPKGDRFATFDRNGGVKVWDTQAKLLRSWELRMPVATVAFTPDGQHLLSANGDGTVYMLELP